MKRVLVLSGCLLVSSVAAAQTEHPPAAPAAPPVQVCATEYLGPTTEPPIITTADLEAMCDQQNAGALFAQVAATCPSTIKVFADAYQKVCRSQPQVGATLELDTMARVFNAATPKLKRPGRSALDLPPRALQAHGASLPASQVAEGIGNFLTVRAEQEVSAYASVELFAKLCDTDLKSLLPKTCALLKGQDNGSDPVGLGLLQRTVLADLKRIPETVLTQAMETQKDPTAEELLCAVDAGRSITREILDHVAIDASFLDKARKDYALFQSPTCDLLWGALKGAAKVQNDLKTLQIDIIALRGENERDQLSTRRDKIVQDVATLLADVRKNTNHEILTELVAIASAAWNEQWLDLVSALANADALGHRVFCGKDVSSDCPTFDKLQSILGLIGDIVAAKDSSGVQAVLNRVAEPVGTWRRKFKDLTTLSLNGYAGARYGYEKFEGDTPTGRLLAPILALGIEWTLPFWTGHIRLFAQVVDVGNVASVHLAGKDSQNLTRVEAEPNIGYLQLFAPGGYLLIAPFKSPFVIGFGGDWVPDLRRTTDGVKHSAWQASAMLSVDVSILELAHK